MNNGTGSFSNRILRDRLARDVWGHGNAASENVVAGSNLRRAANVSRMDRDAGDDGSRMRFRKAVWGSTTRIVHGPLREGNEDLLEGRSVQKHALRTCHGRICCSVDRLRQEDNMPVCEGHVDAASMKGIRHG